MILKCLPNFKHHSTKCLASGFAFFIFFLPLSASANIFSFISDYFDPPAKTIHWQLWSNQSLQAAQSEKHLIFLYVKSNYCHWCQRMTAETLQDQNVIAAINKNFFPIVADLNTDTDIIRQYHLTSLPTILIINPNNHEAISVAEGYLDADHLLQLLSISAQH